MKRSTIHLAELSTAKTLRYREAFDIVKSFIERFVILGKSVVKLNELREIYVSKLAETEFSNANYRSENLKVNLEKTYGKR